MQSPNEAFSRVIIYSQLTAQGWSLADGFCVRYEVVLEDGTCQVEKNNHILTDVSSSYPVISQDKLKIIIRCRELF
jgi:hypothetical protein